MKVNSNFEIIGEVQHPGVAPVGSDIAIDSSDNVYIAGYNYNNYEYVALKYNSDLTVLVSSAGYFQYGAVEPFLPGRLHYLTPATS